jgi:CRISPR-associated protein Cas6
MWQEETSDKQPTHSERVVDLAFRISCDCLPVDHTSALSDAIGTLLPWFEDEPLAGLHLIHVAGSQNGWMRPEGPDEVVYPSKRTRLVLRVPRQRIQDSRHLTGQTIHIDDYTIEIGEATEKPVKPSDILFSRHILSDKDETSFLQWVAETLQNQGLHFKKLLPGKENQLRGPNGPVTTRSLMVADMDLSDSLILQETGIGEGRHFGCGIFIHHKGIKAMKPDEIG